MRGVEAGRELRSISHGESKRDLDKGMRKNHRKDAALRLWTLGFVCPIALFANTSDVAQNAHKEGRDTHLH